MLITDAVFYLFAFILVFAATMVVASRNPVHSVLFLILAFFSSAGLFILCGAEFVGMMLVIVYVGAVAVLFLFVVMMLDIDGKSLRFGFNRYLPMGIVISVILLVELAVIAAAWTTDATAFHAGIGSVASPPEASISNTQALGLVLYTRYFYAFQIAGLILLVAMIGAIVLTLRHKGDVRRQNPEIQKARTYRDSVEIRQIRVGEGVRL